MRNASRIESNADEKGCLPGSPFPSLGDFTFKASEA